MMTISAFKNTVVRNLQSNELFVWNRIQHFVKILNFEGELGGRRIVGKNPDNTSGEGYHHFASNFDLNSEKDYKSDVK